MLITNLYDVTKLDISNLKLEDIEDFSAEKEAELKELQIALVSTHNPEERKPISNRIGYLQFLRTADSFRDKVLADGVVTEEERKEVMIALQALARALNIVSGKDSY